MKGDMMMLSISSFVAGIVGLITIVGSLISAFAEEDNNQPRYMIAHEGPVCTHYTPQAPPTYNFNQQQQMPIPAPIQQAPVQQMIPQYQQPYVWGQTAYINAIANMPTVQNPIYAPYYQYGNPQPNMPYVSAPKTIEYNVDYSGGGTQMNQSTQTRAAPPGMTYACTCSNYTGPQYSYNINDGYARTYENGSTSFCKIPSCYYSNGTWRG
jgi:hypothetical protein